jgi:DNA-binding response OmpR family regulator
LTRPLRRARDAMMAVLETVLVVEDDHALRRLIEQQLFFEGYHVISVEHGAAALHVLNTLTPALVVLDLVLPWVNGIEVLATMRATADLCDVPVVVVTGSATTERDLVSFRPFVVLRKPLNIDGLTTIVQRAVRGY